MLLLERVPEISMETGGSAVVATWENRAQIIEIMRSAREMSQELQDLWNKSGGLGRLSQDHTDQLVQLLRDISNLNEMLLKFA